MRQIEALREESLVTLLRPPQAQSRSQPPSGSPPRGMPPMAAPPAGAARCGPGSRSLNQKFHSQDGRRNKSSPEADDFDATLPEPMKWLLNSLETWIGLKECMAAQIDDPLPQKQMQTPRGTRPDRQPTAVAAGPQRVGWPVPPGGGSQAGRTWCARTSPGLSASSQSPCAPATLAGQRGEESQASIPGGSARGEHSISGGELSQVLQSANTSICSLKGNKNSAPNQDRAFCMDLCGRSTEMFAVFDGHGECGHTVAELCCEVLPKLLLRGMAQTGMLPGILMPNDATCNQPDLREVASKSFEEMHAMVEALTTVNLDAEKEPNQIDGRSSGTTGTVVMMLPGQRLLVGNVGDSSAVFGRRRRGRGLDDYGPWNVTELTRDHKPDVPDEQRRIEEAGAKVVSVGNETLKVSRVYTDHQFWPSINMSRSIGDLHAHTQGLSAKGEVSIMDKLWNPETEDAVLILASDGIWDVMDGAMAASIAAQELGNGGDPAAALCAEALDRWIRRGLPGSYSDDITALVKFF